MAFTRTFLAGFANVLAIFLVIGVISNEYFKETESSSVRSAEPLAQPVPLTGVMAPRVLKSKGGKMGAECVPTDSTPAPTKGSKGGKGGKGKMESAAPSFYCSEAPSGSPTLSLAPSVAPSDVPSAGPSLSPSDVPSLSPSAGPTGIPTTSAAPSTSKGKGGKGGKGGKDGMGKM